MATGPDGRWAAATTGREMPRQNGKGDEIEVVELWGLVQRGEAILHTVHEAVLLTTQAQQRMLSVLDHRDLRGRVEKSPIGVGQQMIQMGNGGAIWYRTRSNGGARGVDNVDRLVVDEAQHATEEHIAASSPTLLANDNPQMNAMGTSAIMNIPGSSSWWWRLRRRSLAADPGRFGYVGHTAERLELADGRVVQHPVDVEDRSLWAAVNPAVAAGRGGGMEFLEEQLQRLGPHKFAGEHLGVWDPDPVDEAEAVALPGWSQLADRGSQIAGSLALAVDVSPDRRWTSIAVAGRTADGRAHVEVIDRLTGTGGVVERVVELRDRWSPVAVVLDPAGPAGSLLADLETARVEVRSATLREAQQACGALYDDVVEKRLVHLGDRVLDAAVAGAKRRLVGDAWLWDRKKSDVDLSPLVAVTLARWAHAATVVGEFFVY